VHGWLWVETDLGGPPMKEDQGLVPPALVLGLSLVMGEITIYPWVGTAVPQNCPLPKMVAEAVTRQKPPIYGGVRPELEPPNS
jgi:hypothetical protein